MDLVFNFRIGYALAHLKPFTLKVVFYLKSAWVFLSKASRRDIQAARFELVHGRPVGLGAVMVKFRKSTQKVLQRQALANRRHKSQCSFDLTEAHNKALFEQKDIDRAMERLDDTLRVPLVMFMEGLKHEEISVYLRLPLKTVKNRILMAQQSLKHHLLEHEQMFL